MARALSAYGARLTILLKTMTVETFTPFMSAIGTPAAFWRFLASTWGDFGAI